MTICPSTMLTVPECSCPRCLEDQLRRFQPRLVEAEPTREASASPPLARAGAAPPPEQRLAA